MKSVTTSINNAFANPWVALTARLCLIAVIAGAMLLLTPHFALAQQGGGGSGSNPFADSGARSTALDVLQSLRFWVWIAAGVGFCSYLLAYFAQGIVPSFFQQYRDYLRNGALLMVAFGVVIQFIVSQAGA
jgi:hypothetical protein